MIGLLTQNNLYAMTLLDILKDCGVELFQKGSEYEALLLVSPWPNLLPNGKYITIGAHIESEIAHIDTPIHPSRLIQKINQVVAQQLNAITFENKNFIFQKGKRLLICKTDHQQISLTEKENDLLSVLAEAFPKALTKEDLLRLVWNYKAELETHTLESHIYGLRQKIGKNVDALFQSTDCGYQLMD